MPGWPPQAHTAPAPAAAAAVPQAATAPHAAGPHRPQQHHQQHQQQQQQQQQQHPPPAAAAAAAVPAPRPMDPGHIRLTPAPAATAPGGVPQAPVAAAAPVAPEPDFAEQKPDQYKAFCAMAVHNGEGGTTIGLPNNMCVDRHVPDFLKCLQCWLFRSFGDPAISGRYWRLQGLDLSKNNLSNASLCQVIDLLKDKDVRVDRLLFSHNKLDASGLASLTEYIWNCKEAIVEVDVSYNEIVADPHLGQGGEDVVSSLLRCLYNHSKYPLSLHQGGVKILPFRLKIGGNRVADPAKLLRMIKSRGGKTHVNILPRPDAYDKTDDKEYLSIYLCDFLDQRADAPGTAAQAAPAHREKKEKKSKKNKAAEVPPEVEIPHAISKLDAKSKSKSKEKSRTPPSNAPTPVIPSQEKRKRDKKEKKEKELKKPKTMPQLFAAVAAAGAPEGRFAIEREDQSRLTDLLVQFFSSEDVGLGSETNASMVAEYTVCMLISGRHWQALAGELKTFLPEESEEFVSTFFAWLKQTLQEQFPKVWQAVRGYAI